MKNSNSNVYIIISILLLVVTKVTGQSREFKNLQEYVTKNNLYDFGYGLEKYESRIDSIVCFNDFMSPELFFKEMDKNLYFTNNDSVFKITIKRKREKILGIDICSNKKVINKLVLNDSLNDYNLIKDTYIFKSGKKTYSILYLSNEVNQQTLRSQFLAILIDNENKNIVLFPRYQSTTSLLNITDLNRNDKLDLVCYNPSFTGRIETFELDSKNWKLLKDYSCNLKLSDGFVWQIDFSDDCFLEKYYKSKAFR